MNASLAQRNDYQVKCYELNLAQLSGRLQWRRDDDDDEKRRWVHQKKAQRTRPNCFLEAEPNPKSRTYVADRTPAKEPNLWKREGEALTSPGHPLTNLTTVKLSRKRCPKTSGRTCVESMLCKVHPELYIPPLTQPTNNAPDLCHFTRLSLLCWFEVDNWRTVVCWLGWTDLLVWCGGDGLIWWADFGDLVWRWSGVGVGAWSDLWSDLRLLRLCGVVVWSEADLTGCSGGPVLWSNLEVWLRKMVWSDGQKLERWEA